MGKINLVFDIDDLLACTSACSDKCSALFFLRKRLILTALKTHYVFPGVVELMQLLFKTENVCVSFYSSAVKERNDIFVRELLTRALGDEGYNRVKDRVKILSRDDQVPVDFTRTKRQFDQFGIYHRDKKKDISPVLEEGDDIRDAVLIDDDSTYSMMGQERNLFNVPFMDQSTFCSSESETNTYDPEGYKKLSCKLIRGEHDRFISDVISGEEILLCKKESGYELGFFSTKTKQYEEQKISSDDHPELIAYLDRLFDGESYWLERGEELDKVHAIVALHHGKTKKLYSETNRICFIAGVIFEAMEKAQKEQTHITDVLFEWQFKKLEGGKFIPKFHEFAGQDHFILEGLRRLQEMNKDLALTTPHSYKACIMVPPTKEEHEILEKAIANDHVSSLI